MNSMERAAKIERRTKETDICVELHLDGGAVEIDTGIGFFDHMLHAFAFYAGIGLTVRAKGDLQVDGHHTVEDVGIAIGEALKGALGEKAGIRRFASAYVPMDEARPWIFPAGPFWCSTPPCLRRAAGSTTPA